MNDENSLAEQLYQEGYDAYLQGIDVDECPYQPVAKVGLTRASSQHKFRTHITPVIPEEPHGFG